MACIPCTWTGDANMAQTGTSFERLPNPSRDALIVLTRLLARSAAREYLTNREADLRTSASEAMT